jgi:hypothetical protein
MKNAMMKIKKLYQKLKVCYKFMIISLRGYQCMRFYFIIMNMYFLCNIGVVDELNNTLLETNAKLEEVKKCFLTIFIISNFDIDRICHKNCSQLTRINICEMRFKDLKRRIAN